MSRPLTIRWEERDQTWQAPAGEFYVDSQGCRRRREIILRYPHTGLPVARDDREGAWAALVHVLEILIDHPQLMEREVQPIEFETQPIEREREVQPEARPTQLDAWAKKRELVRECLLSPEPAVELKTEPASKSKYAAALKGEAAPLAIDPGWFDLDQRRDRIIASLVGIIQDPSQSSRERLGALNALIRLDKQIRHERHLKGQQDPSEEAAAIVFGEISSGTRLSWRFRFFPMALVPKSATSLEKIEWEPVYHGDFPKKKRRSRQNRRPSNRLGKFDWEPVYHGDRETKRDPIGEPFRIGEAIRISEAARTRPPQNSEPPSSPPDFQGNAV